MPTYRPPASVASQARAQASTRALEQVAWLMDQAFKVPGTEVSVGLDAILGLFPVFGDLLTGLVQIGVVLFTMANYRVPKPVAARMAANVLLDIGVGCVPIVGDVFDVFFKANTRNLQLLREIQDHQAKGEAIPTRSSVWYLVGIVAAFVLAIGFVTALFVVLLLWAFQALGHGPAR